MFILHIGSLQEIKKLRSLYVHKAGAKREREKKKDLGRTAVHCELNCDDDDFIWNMI